MKLSRRDGEQSAYSWVPLGPNSDEDESLLEDAKKEGRFAARRMLETRLGPQEIDSLEFCERVIREIDPGFPWREVPALIVGVRVMNGGPWSLAEWCSRAV